MVAISISAAVAEFVAMMIFVYVSAGTAAVTASAGAASTAFGFKVAFTFGTAIMVLAYTVGHHSGAQINCAVTFGLAIAGALNPIQAVINFLAQLTGGTIGALLIAATVKNETDQTGSLGCNMVSAGYSKGNALCGEIIMTFLLMYCVLETAVSKKSEGNRVNAAIAIGFAVYLGHSILIPVDGCSINPTRSMSTALAAEMLNRDTVQAAKDADIWDAWADMWIFWVGPLTGAGLAVGLYKAMEKLNAIDDAKKEDGEKYEAGEEA